MKLTETRSLQVVIYEGAEAAPLDSGMRKKLTREVLGRGYGVRRATGEDDLRSDARTHCLVVGQFGGLTPEGGGFSGGDNVVQVLDLGQIPGGDDERVTSVIGEADRLHSRDSLFDHKAWKPWFPVIDYDRCTNCMQCLSFCLFGVYGVSKEQQIQVQNHDNCKTNCPACSRVCPEAAIMFPKYKAGPINGDTVSDQELEREKMKVDISSLLGGDVYDLLRTRSERAKSRFSKERDSDKALNERQKCLVKLQKDSDIPPEVLMSLPGPEEIQRRAAEASAKADAAIRANQARQQSGEAG